MLNELVQLLVKNVPASKAQLIEATDAKCDSSILIEPSSLYETVKFLKNNQEMPFNALQVISGVDYTSYLEVCYMFAYFHPETSRDLILKTRLTDRVSGEVDTISDLFPAAEFQERECYDMLGVRFKNHPDPRRILCPDDWEGFPLRKDYVAQKTYRGMEVYPDSKMNFEDREFIVRQEMIKKAQEAASQG